MIWPTRVEIFHFFLLNTITPRELGAVSEQQTNFAQIRKATSSSLFPIPPDDGELRTELGGVVKVLQNFT